MKIERIENIDALLDFRTEWERLFEQAKTNNVFLTFEWMSLWCKYLCKEVRPLILAFKENGRYLGIAPLMIRRGKKFNLPIRKIEFLSASDADRLDFIIPDRKEEVLRELFRFFFEDYIEWEILEFSDIPDFSSSAESSEGDGGLSSTSSLKGLKKDFRRINNRLLRLGLKAGFERFTELETAKGLLQEMIEIENKSWKGSSGVGIFSNKDKVSFHKELIEALAKKDMLDIAILRLDKNIAAYIYSFKFNSTCQGYNMAYLPEYSHLSPGVLLIHFLIEDFFLKGGREFDFLKGDEPWKQRWTNLYRTHFRIRVFNKKPYARLLMLLCMCNNYTKRALLKMYNYE